MILPPYNLARQIRGTMAQMRKDGYTPQSWGVTPELLAGQRVLKGHLTTDEPLWLVVPEQGLANTDLMVIAGGESTAIRLLHYQSGRQPGMDRWIHTYSATPTYRDGWGISVGCDPSYSLWTHKIDPNAFLEVGSAVLYGRQPMARLASDFAVCPLDQFVGECHEEHVLALYDVWDYGRMLAERVVVERVASWRMAFTMGHPALVFPLAEVLLNADAALPDDLRREVYTFDFGDPYALPYVRDVIDHICDLWVRLGNLSIINFFLRRHLSQPPHDQATEPLRGYIYLLAHQKCAVVKGLAPDGIAHLNALRELLEASVNAGKGEAAAQCYASALGVAERLQACDPALFAERARWMLPAVHLCAVALYSAVSDRHRMIKAAGRAVATYERTPVAQRGFLTRPIEQAYALLGRQPPTPETAN